MMKNKSYSESETDLLMTSTDTLGANKGLPQEVRRDVERFSKFLWNPMKNQFMRRSDTEWARLLFFYFCFMGGLTVYASIAFGIYLEVYIDKNHPRANDENLLQGLPSVGFRPMPDHRFTMIRFVQGQPFSYKPFSDHIQALLYMYENQMQESEALIDCENLPEKDRPRNKACRFLIDWLGPQCTWQMDYGYDWGQPCVLLKLNKIFNWMPVPYNSTNCPPELRGQCTGMHVHVTCEGENPIDQENIGPFQFWPPTGYPIYYYPYLNQEGYRAPLVMVKFLKPTNGVVINVWCKAWAQNIKHHRQDAQGSIHFELLID
jgi:sodium/potassium-transporting ATPase subunit beta